MIGHGGTPDVRTINRFGSLRFRLNPSDHNRQQHHQRHQIHKPPMSLDPRSETLTKSHAAWAVLEGLANASAQAHYSAGHFNAASLQFNMTALEAWAASSLFYDHLLHCHRHSRTHTGGLPSAQGADRSSGPVCSPEASIAELQHPQAQHLLALLARLWAAHSSPDQLTDGSHTTWSLSKYLDSMGRLKLLPKEHCSKDAGALLLQQIQQAVAALQQASCQRTHGTRAHWGQSFSFEFLQEPGDGDGDDSTGASSRSSSSGEARGLDERELSMPYVLLRRATMALLQLLYAQRHGACREAVAKVAPPMLLSFAGAMNCSRAARPAVELLHISKSGGTSMCQLAAKSGLSNPGANMHRNCLNPVFRDEPKWSRLEEALELRPGPKRLLLWPAVNCERWPQLPEVSCHDRAHMVFYQGMNFYANELTLHEGTHARGSARACPEVETVVMLRQPVDRVRSHVIEIDKVYSQFSKFGIQYKRTRNLQQWQEWAPALLDNYVIRSLLGRKFMHCREFGTIGEGELLSASLALSSIDHILLMEKSGLNEVIMRAGLGWNHSLGSVHWRWSHQHDLHHDLGFPVGTMELVKQWNALDTLLYKWGGTLLTLDAAFHSAVAALTGKLKQGTCGVHGSGAAAAAGVEHGQGAVRDENAAHKAGDQESSAGHSSQGAGDQQQDGGQHRHGDAHRLEPVDSSTAHSSHEGDRGASPSEREGTHSGGSGHLAAGDAEGGRGAGQFNAVVNGDGSEEQRHGSDDPVTGTASALHPSKAERQAGGSGVGAVDAAHASATDAAALPAMDLHQALEVAGVPLTAADAVAIARGGKRRKKGGKRRRMSLTSTSREVRLSSGVELQVVRGGYVNIDLDAKAEAGLQLATLALEEALLPFGTLGRVEAEVGTEDGRCASGVGQVQGSNGVGVAGVDSTAHKGALLTITGAAGGRRLMMASEPEDKQPQEGALSGHAAASHNSEPSGSAAKLPGKAGSAAVHPAKRKGDRRGLKAVPVEAAPAVGRPAKTLPGGKAPLVFQLPLYLGTLPPERDNSFYLVPGNHTWHAGKPSPDAGKGSRSAHHPGGRSDPRAGHHSVGGTSNASVDNVQQPHPGKQPQSQQQR